MATNQNKALPFVIENGVRQFNFKQSCSYLQEMGKEQFGPDFRLYNSDKEIIYKLMIYAIRDKENCTLHGIDLNKGVLLNGPVGCGKTSLMTLIRPFLYPPFYFSVIQTREIAMQYNREGFPVIHNYGRSQKVYCFDDLGVEESVKHFGNECNTIAEILLHRYDLLINYGITTHATTNLNSDELEKRYGNRVRSRLRTMFNLISFPETVKDKRR